MSKKTFINSLLVLLLVSGCTLEPGSEIKKKALSLENAGQFVEASEYLLAISRSHEDFTVRTVAAQEGYRISFFLSKDYKKSAEFLKSEIRYSSDNYQRLEAQKKLVSVYFDQLGDYISAEKEINKLLPKIMDLGERSQFQMKLARCYFYLQNFSQAENELKELLNKSTESRDRFQATILLANIYLSRKNKSKAIELFNLAIEEYPELAISENVPVTLAVVYEETKDFKNALAVLEANYDRYENKELIGIRINRLKEIKNKQPGAKGLRK